jgi:hypothetical protein
MRHSTPSRLRLLLPLVLALPLITRAPLLAERGASAHGIKSLEIRDDGQRLEGRNPVMG